LIKSAFVISIETLIQLNSGHCSRLSNPGQYYEETNKPSGRAECSYDSGEGGVGQRRFGCFHDELVVLVGFRSRVSIKPIIIRPAQIKKPSW